jgi:hypothetical protein
MVLVSAQLTVGEAFESDAVDGCHLIDVGLGARDRFVVEPRESRRDLFDLFVELVVGDGAVDVAVLLRSGRVESSATSRISSARPRPTSLESRAIGPPPGM